MDLARIKKAYLIGIKGVGMTMLAQFLAEQGIEVSGSDVKETFMTDAILGRLGIRVHEGFSEANVPADADLIIYSTAYNSKTNPELAKAVIGKTRSIPYAVALGEIFNQKYGIAVAGSAGKTTTTAWLGYLLNRSGFEPNVLVGANVPQFNGASLVSRSDLMLIEADEYQNKLQYFQPKAVLLNNIDYDHPDYFPTLESYQRVFLDFIQKIPRKGFLVANFDDDFIRRTARVNCHGRVIGYAIDQPADYVAYDIRSAGGRQYFKVRMAAREDDPTFADPSHNHDHAEAASELGDFRISLAGRHNISNALAVIAAAIELEVPLLDIRRYIGEFTSTSRRMELMGEYRGVPIVDDYAHHPAKVKAALDGIRQLYPKERLVVVFHPHTFTRTKALIDEFAASFAPVDELVVLDIYGSAREEQGGVSSLDLIAKIKDLPEQPKAVVHQPRLEDAEQYLRQTVKKGDVVLLMGAGDVFRVGEKLVGK
ncbi:UDP-N-acetylmuramate--L-alanine ligase [Candidatus Falkowbacteria bacterium]|nr:UDP-N-acetylmuramate--L-alanine ligase [Candidatus Falkowbacteria bacterium]